jgi:hypothetical protein
VGIRRGERHRYNRTCCNFQHIYLPRDLLWWSAPASGAAIHVGAGPFILLRDARSSERRRSSEKIQIFHVPKHQPTCHSECPWACGPPNRMKILGSADPLTRPTPAGENAGCGPRIMKGCPWWSKVGLIVPTFTLRSTL